MEITKQQSIYYWVKHQELFCAPAKLVEKKENKVILEDIDGKMVEQKESEAQIIHNSCFEGLSDLLFLGDFNENSSLHNIRIRYGKDQIYCQVGQPILIAINPYKTLPIYTNQIAKKYKIQMNQQQIQSQQIEPHLFQIAEMSYQQLFELNVNQAIVISGESGSGKTESTKIILKYLANSHTKTNANPTNNEMSDTSNIKQIQTQNQATQNQNSKQQLSSNEQKPTKKNLNPSVEEQILDANPLLEAFGNAQTIRNDNSSRFGKFIKIMFNNQRQIHSAQIISYLLEKCRIIKISQQERSYHIFYQIFFLGQSDKENFYYLKQPQHYSYLKTGDLINNTDEINFKYTNNCMDVLNFTENEKENIYKIISSILQIGNIDFDQNEEQHSSIKQKTQIYLEYASNLLQIDKNQLIDMLTTKKIIDPSSKQFISKKNTKDQALTCRDGLSKSIYCKLFDWLIEKVNIALQKQQQSQVQMTVQSQNQKKNLKQLQEIGILDIFGFEIFKDNSFEQLCINFANEKLQQHFNQHMFKLEQSEYQAEDISWSHIQFKDNQNTIDLFEKGAQCIYGIIDDVCKLPKANDQTLQKKLFSDVSNPQIFNPGGKISSLNFGVHHFAGDVIYDVTEFLDKNRDSSDEYYGETLKNSQNPIIQILFQKKEDDSNINNNFQKKNLVSKKSLTVSSAFRLQLDDLILNLSKSHPFYVRCIKPNSVKQPNNFDSMDILRQLQCAGLLEAIRIRKAGYAIRRQIHEFLKRYRALSPQILKNYSFQSDSINNSRQTALKFMESLINVKQFKEKMDPKLKLWQIGKTKVFLKEEIKTLFDSQLNIFFAKYVLILQKNLKMLKYRKKFLETKQKIYKIQKLAKVFLLKKIIKAKLKFIKKSAQKVSCIIKVHHCKLILQKLKKIKLQKIKQQQEEQEKLIKLKQLTEQKQLSEQSEGYQDNQIQEDQPRSSISRAQVNQYLNSQNIQDQSYKQNVQENSTNQNYFFGQLEKFNNFDFLESQLQNDQSEKEIIQQELQNMRLSIQFEKQQINPQQIFNMLSGQQQQQLNINEGTKIMFDPLLQSTSLQQFISNVSESESKVLSLETQLDSLQKKFERFQKQKESEIQNEIMQKQHFFQLIETQKAETLQFQLQIQEYKSKSAIYSETDPKIIQKYEQQLKEKQQIIQAQREAEHIKQLDNMINIKKLQNTIEVLKNDLKGKDEEINEKVENITAQYQQINELNKTSFELKQQSQKFQNMLTLQEEENKIKDLNMQKLLQKIQSLEQNIIEIKEEKQQFLQQQILNQKNVLNSDGKFDQNELLNIQIEYKNLLQVKQKQKEIIDGNKEMCQTLINLLKLKSIEVDQLKKTLKVSEQKEDSELFKELAKVKANENVLMEKLQKQTQKIQQLEKQIQNVQQSVQQ